MKSIFLCKEIQIWKIMLLLPLFLASSGCALKGSQITGTVAKTKQLLGVSQYYVKSHVKLRAKPDRNSKMVVQLKPNTKVTEITKNDLGWSQVHTEGNGHQGWLPTSELSKQPVTYKPMELKQKPAKPAKAETEPQKSQEASSSGTSEAKKEEATTPAAGEETEKSDEGGILSPSPAAAETIPEKPAETSEPPMKRKVDPKMFDAF